MPNDLVFEWCLGASILVATILFAALPIALFIFDEWPL
jgi:hypothetical protein